MGCAAHAARRRAARVARQHSHGVGLTRERGRVVMVAGHAALTLARGPGWESLTGGTGWRTILIVLLPCLVLAAEAPPAPTGYGLFA